mgnify:CR=1 FL=1
MVREKIYDLGDRIDHEIGFAGNYGKKGEKRAKRTKATPEQIKKQNQWNKTKRADRKIRANFKEGESTYITLTYKKELRPQTMGDFKDDRSRFLKGMRAEYKKAGITFKWVSRVEIGKRGAVHMHILVNDIPGVNMIALVKNNWDKGRPDLKPVDDLNSGKLAEYFTKLAPDEIKGQVSWMNEQDQKTITAYSCSRNLIVPEPEIKQCSRRTVEKAIRDGIKPTPGYKVIPESVIYGTNPFTGYSYLHYNEIRENHTGEWVTVPGKEERPPWL